MQITQEVPNEKFEVEALKDIASGRTSFSVQEIVELLSVFVLEQEIDPSKVEINKWLKEFIPGLDLHTDAPGDLFDLYKKTEVTSKFETLKTNIQNEQLDKLRENIAKKFVDVVGNLKERENQTSIPNEPWTPTIQNICIDYTACANKEDIELIHLYPFEGTYKHEDIKSQPTLLPFFEDEGTLFIGFKDLRPGYNLHLLLQLAEATADTEMDRALVQWAYLSNNQWQPLREGFEIISDETDGLTRSGIIKISIPSGISRTGNTIMPSDLYWIKAFVGNSSNATGAEIRPGKVKAICDALTLHPQAAKVTFSDRPNNFLERLEEPIPKESISKLLRPLAGVKKVTQPYESFGGRNPEKGTNFYQRVSEHLRHKGRAIAAFDYETLILDAFPEIFKVKCINHDLGLSAREYKQDVELAPGFVTLAVIPDLKKLAPGQGLEPRAPVSILENIRKYLKKRISPFIRLKVLNPRYEKIGIDITVKLREGRNEAYYSAKLKEELIQFLAPWIVHKNSDLLVFGKTINHSEIVKFVETLDFVDFITSLELHQDEISNAENTNIIDPLTSRSILTAGKICVNITDKPLDSFYPGSTTPEDRSYNFNSVCEDVNHQLPN